MMLPNVSAALAIEMDPPVLVAASHVECSLEFSGPEIAGNMSHSTSHIKTLLEVLLTAPIFP